MAAVRNQLNDFQVEEFFNALLNALRASLNENLPFDSAEFLACHLDGYKRNLNVVNSRLRKTYPEQEQLLGNLGSLIRVIHHHQREFCEALSFRNFFVEDQLAAHSVVRVRRSGVGRPEVEITQALLETLHQMLKLLGILEFQKEQYDDKEIHLECQATAKCLVAYATMIWIKLSAKFCMQRLELAIGSCKVDYVTVVSTYEDIVSWTLYAGLIQLWSL